MSLIKCMECGGNLSDKATACPHCGAPIEISIICPNDQRGEVPDFDEEKQITTHKSDRYKKLLASAITDYEKSIATIILLCIHDLDFELGVQKLTQILTGKQTKFITDYELQYNPAFSLLKQYSRNDVKDVIDVLRMMGYIEQEDIGRNRNVLCLTDKSYDYLDGREEFEGSFIDILTKNDFIELDEEQLELYEVLRRKRHTIAKESELPAYIVCYDRPLRCMALNRPTTEEELLAIKGIGEAFITKYGAGFIQVIEEFKDRDND